jgi:signal transduction histidine kinase
MQREFILFISFLILCGGISSWWLFRAQQQRLKQTREFEQKMARQHEDAALGRAAATITHELRNPLNAIGMGLQRMQIESKNLDNEHKALLHSMRESVQRSNTIITRLRQYSDSFTVAGSSVNIPGLLSEVFKLYQAQSEKQQIDIQFDCGEDLTVTGDNVLLAQLFENLIKNSIEAQNKSGFINVQCHSKGANCVISIVNGGFTLSEEESLLILEPYFTSKSRGTGLGLVISKKIVQAHGGELDYQINFAKQIIQFNIILPLAGS